MRKVVVCKLLSLDGIAEDPDQFITEWDDAMDANLARVIATQDTVLRLTRELFERRSLRTTEGARLGVKRLDALLFSAPGPRAVLGAGARTRCAGAGHQRTRRS